MASSQAALFSAILTAFNVEVYKQLQPDPMDDVVATLKNISQQLSSFSISHPFVNSTQPVHSPRDFTTQDPFIPRRLIIVINTLWFSSLVFSLASASLALLVKQSLYELTYRIPSTSREGAQIRQHRLDNLMEWRISAIILAIPLLLQIALILFLTGLVLLLWSLQDTVATITTLWVGVLFVFLATFALIPAVQWRCSYRSPQAYFAYAIVRLVHDGTIKLATWGVTFCTHRILSKNNRWLMFLPWSMLRRWCKPISSWSPYGRWEARERAYLSSQKASLDLDVASGARACTETLDPTCLDNVRVALSAECNAMSLAACLRSLDWMDISKSNRAILLKRNDHHSPKALPTFFRYALQQMFTIPREDRHATRRWEKDVAALRGSLNQLEDDIHDNTFLYVNFMVAMEAKLEGTVRDALTDLAGAVASRPNLEYLTLSRSQ